MLLLMVPLIAPIRNAEKYQTDYNEPKLENEKKIFQELSAIHYGGLTSHRLIVSDKLQQPIHQKIRKALAPL